MLVRRQVLPAGLNSSTQQGSGGGNLLLPLARALGAVESLTCSQPSEPGAAQNLLYDISQIAIPFDRMDASE